MSEPSAKQVHLLLKLLRENGASDDGVGKTRQMLEAWRTGKATVSNWIERLSDDDPIVSGEAGIEICRLADSRYYQRLARRAKDYADRDLSRWTAEPKARLK